MRRFLGGTRGRLVAFSVVILAAALLIADGGVFVWLTTSERSESDSVLVSQADTIASSIEDTNGKLSFDSTDLPGETSGGIAVDAAIVDASGPVAQTPAQPLSNRVLLRLAQRARQTQGPVWADLSGDRGIPRRMYAIPLQAGTDSAPVLVVSRSVAEMQTTLMRTFLLLALLSVVMVVTGGLLAYWLAGRALRPVRRIAGLARSLSEHDLHRRVDVEVPPDELGELVDTFNAMLARLEAAFESLRQFTADASHELRAPLALIRAELEGSLSRARGQAEYRRSQETLLVEVEHLSRLADQLLMLARADAGALVPSPEAIDVVDFLHETAARWETAAEARGVHIEVVAPDTGSLAADPALLRRLVDNLVDNAVRHTPTGSEVLVSAYRANGGWHLEVADHGPGVPVEYRDRLFTRFSRPDDSRSRDGGGAGLGLALSAAIARAHGGRLTLVSGNGRGATFRLYLRMSSPLTRVLGTR